MGKQRPRRRLPRWAALTFGVLLLALAPATAASAEAGNAEPPHGDHGAHGPGAASTPTPTPAAPSEHADHVPGMQMPETAPVGASADPTGRRVVLAGFATVIVIVLGSAGLVKHREGRGSPALSGGARGRGMRGRDE